MTYSSPSYQLLHASQYADLATPANRTIALAAAVAETYYEVTYFKITASVVSNWTVKIDTAYLIGSSTAGSGVYLGAVTAVTGDFTYEMSFPRGYFVGAANKALEVITTTASGVPAVEIFAGIWTHPG